MTAHRAGAISGDYVEGIQPRACHLALAVTINSQPAEPVKKIQFCRLPEKVSHTLAQETWMKQIKLARPLQYCMSVIGKYSLNLNECIIVKHTLPVLPLSLNTLLPLFWPLS